MTGREALNSALAAANKLEVRGKENILNLALIIQLLEALRDTENNKQEDEVNG